MGFVPILVSVSLRRATRAIASGALVATALAAPLAASGSGTLDPDSANLPAGLSGRVLQSSSPVVEAKVFAYQLVERSLQKVLTDGRGRFAFDALPAGIYKIIAHKAGFEPTVMLLQRNAADAAQSVTLELERQPPAGADEAADFWSARSQIPPDVLRSLDLPGAPLVAIASSAPGEIALDAPAAKDGELRAQVAAMTGVQEVKPQADARVSGGNIGVFGELGRVKVFLNGDFQSIEGSPASPGAMQIDGYSRAVSLSLQTPNQGVFDLSSTSNELKTSEHGLLLPVEASHYVFGWNRGVGENGETTIRGSYTQEIGLYNKGWVEPIEMPFSSRTLSVEGNYTHKLESGKVRAGLRYRERSGLYAERFAGSSDESVSEFLDAYGDGDWRVNDAVLLEYGLFTTLRDGSVSLTPRGGVVLQLGEDWQTSATVAHRVTIDQALVPDDFLPMFVSESFDCSQSEIACYELGLRRGAGDGDNFAFGGSYRELDSTVRLFLSANFFDHSEGLFLVPGDRVPEAHASYRKRLGSDVVTRISTSYAEGGSGVYRAANNRQFENNVELLSASFDTRFETTATGVFVAFHRLEQQLDPVHQPGRRIAPTVANLERLEVLLNQNLSTLFDLTGDWAVQLGLELARGASFFHSDADPEALRRQVMTGVAVRF